MYWGILLEKTTLCSRCCVFENFLWNKYMPYYFVMLNLMRPNLMYFLKYLYIRNAERYILRLNQNNDKFGQFIHSIIVNMFWKGTKTTTTIVVKTKTKDTCVHRFNTEFWKWITKTEVYKKRGRDIYILIHKSNSYCKE